MYIIVEYTSNVSDTKLKLVSPENLEINISCSTELKSLPSYTNFTMSDLPFTRLKQFHFSGVSHGKVGTHHYFLSWREPWNKFEDWDWFNGRNFCRERCMDLISFDNPGEFKMFEEVMIAGNIYTALLNSQNNF